MNTEYLVQAREVSAYFIESLIRDTGHILKQEPNKFTFQTYIDRIDPQKRSPAGWMPIIIPDLIVQQGEGIKARHLPNSVFLPAHVGIPIDRNLWTILNIPFTQSEIGYNDLVRISPFEDVKALWYDVAKRLRSKELDRFIVPLTELQRFTHSLRYASEKTFTSDFRYRNGWLGLHEA
jgi:hypothetical protein